MDSMSKTHATALIYELPFRFHTLHSRSRKVPRNRGKVLHFVQAFIVFDQEILFHGTLFLTFPERQKEACVRNRSSRLYTFFKIAKYLTDTKFSFSFSDHYIKIIYLIIFFKKQKYLKHFQYFSFPDHNIKYDVVPFIKTHNFG